MPYKDIEAKRACDRRYYERTKPVTRLAEKQSTLAELAREAERRADEKLLKYKPKGHGLKIAVITDVQAKPGVPLDHLTWCGKYLADKRPDVIVCIGDFADMQSLSTYDKGTGRCEGRRYKADIAASAIAMNKLIEPMAKTTGWAPRLVMTYGNHEHRITRATTDDPMWEGVLNLEDLKYADYGWECIPFLKPIVIGGVSFCHYFPSGVMGRPITTARALLTKLHMSSFAGHQQGRDIAYARRSDGRDMTAIISGSFYQHDETYLNPFTNNHWRGFYMLHEVQDGAFDEMAISINFLKRRFGTR